MKTYVEFLKHLQKEDPEAYCAAILTNWLIFVSSISGVRFLL